jgi:hypothetical protein
MSVHVPLRGPRVNNPLLLLPARERRAIKDSLMPFRITLLNEAWRGMDGVGRRPVRGQASPAVIVQEDRFDSTSSITLCVFTTDPTEAPLLRMLIEPTNRSFERLTLDGRQGHHRSEGATRQADRKAQR